ncbi:hypothetical protein [Streptomyces sp. NPDC005799]|uniref:hypothetical protein n=1 Tax=Streptomyces sp. NPDC005799 TaxID=3154678 RepID=UPI0033DFFE3D
MASGETTSTVQCPECEEPIEFPVRACHLSKTEVALAIDLAPVREHIDGHQVPFTAELPMPVHLDADAWPWRT